MYVFFGYDKDENRIDLPMHLTLDEIKQMGIVRVESYNEAQSKIKSSSAVMREFFENMNNIFSGSEEV